MIDVKYSGNRAKRVDLGEGKAINVMKYHGKYIVSYIEGSNLIQKEYNNLKAINH